MNRTSLILIAAIGIPTLVNATTPGSVFRNSQFQAKPRLIVALQDNHPTTGTDSGSTLYPNAGIDTHPVKDTGTETKAKKPPLPGQDSPPSPNAPVPPISNSDTTLTK